MSATRIQLHAQPYTAASGRNYTYSVLHTHARSHYCMSATCLPRCGACVILLPTFDTPQWPRPPPSIAGAHFECCQSSHGSACTHVRTPPPPPPLGRIAIQICTHARTRTACSRVHDCASMRYVYARTQLYICIGAQCFKQTRALF